MNEWGSQREIMAILQRVNHMVAFEFESNPEDLSRRNKKQIPPIVSHLTKRLYFPTRMSTEQLNTVR